MQNNNPRNKISLLNETILAQKCEITELIDQVEHLKSRMTPDETVRKLSPCCAELLLPFISLNLKICRKCKKEYNWDLDDQQKPLFQRNMD